MEKPRFVVTVKGVALSKGRILICNTASGWVLPGGTKEKGETLEEALKREIYEELGVRCKIKDLLHAHAYRTPGGEEKVGIYYLIELLGVPLPQSEVLELKWIGEDQIEELRAAEGFKDLLKVLFSKLRANPCQERSK